MARIRHILISEGHNYVGHHGMPPGTHAMRDMRSVCCVAGQGIVGDRFFGHRTDFKGQLTLFAWEVLGLLRRELQVPDLKPEALRRNVVVEGLDLNALVGTRFALQSLELEGVEECRPCYWMEQAVCAGAEAWLKGRGGLRCRILRGGELTRDAD